MGHICVCTGWGGILNLNLGFINFGWSFLPTNLHSVYIQQSEVKHCLISSVIYFSPIYFLRENCFLRNVQSEVRVFVNHVRIGQGNFKTCWDR